MGSHEAAWEARPVHSLSRGSTCSCQNLLAAGYRRKAILCHSSHRHQCDSFGACADGFEMDSDGCKESVKKGLNRLRQGAEDPVSQTVENEEGSSSATMEAVVWDGVSNPVAWRQRLSILPLCGANSSVAWERSMVKASCRPNPSLPDRRAARFIQAVLRCDAMERRLINGDV